MTWIAVIIGSAASATASGAQTLPMSDRGAIALAMARFGADVRAYAADADARCFARAAGIETVEAISDPEMGAFDVALIGRGGCAERGDLLPARLAEASGAALVYDVIDVQREADGLSVTRDLGRGARDLLSVRGRAVLVIAESVERGPYVSRYRMNAAKSDSAESAKSDSAESAKSDSAESAKAASGESAARKEPSCVEWEPATPRVRLGDHAVRVAGSAVERMNALFGVGEIAENTATLVRGSAEECARHLLRYLGHHGLVGREISGGPQSASEAAVAPQEAQRRPERPQSAARGAMDSQPAARRPERSATGAASIPIRLQRRPRPLNDRPFATRGPFEIGVDR